MDKFFEADITAYLWVFAKRLGHMWGLEHELDYDDELMTGMVEQIYKRVAANDSIPLFGQVLDDACKKCKLRYSERGGVTNKEYHYCIRTDNTSENIAIDCPVNRNTVTSVITKVEDDQDIIDIRKRLQRNGG